MLWPIVERLLDHGQDHHHTDEGSEFSVQRIQREVFSGGTMPWHLTFRMLRHSPARNTQKNHPPGPVSPPTGWRPKCIKTVTATVAVKPAATRCNCCRIESDPRNRCTTTTQSQGAAHRSNGSSELFSSAPIKGAIHRKPTTMAWQRFNVRAVVVLITTALIRLI